MSTKNDSDTAASATSQALQDKHLEFLVGQDPEGHWLAIETHGLAGGLFCSRDTALHYARDESHRRPGAVRLVRDPLHLDIPK